MALTVPQTRSVLPEQNAQQGIDPSRQFGNQIANPINLPDVLQGQGGYQIDTTAESNAYAKLGSSVSAAVSEVIDNQNKKELALRRANETVALEKDKIDFHNSASEAMQTTRLLRQSGDLVDDDDAKGYYAEKLSQLREKHLAEGKYKDIEVSTHAKLYSLQADNKYKESFRDHVIIPDQTNRFVKTLNETNNSRSIQALNDGRTTPVENIVPSLQSGLAAIDEQHNLPAMHALMKPEQIEASRQKAKLQYVQSFMVGASERGIDFSDTRQDKLTLWGKQIANQQQIKQLILGDPSVATAFGSHIDEATRQIDNSIMQKQTLIETESTRRQTAAIAAAERAERQAVAAVKADVGINGADSKFLLNIDKLPPVQKAAALDGYETFARRQTTTLGQAQDYDKRYAGKTNALTNPTKDDVQRVDNHFEIAKNQIAKLAPAEQQQFLERNYYTVGVVPTEVRDNITRGLNSSDPAIVKVALDAMQSIERSNPTALSSAFKPEQKSMLVSYKAGVDSAKIINYRDKQSALEGRPDSEVNKLAYKAAGNVKNEVDFKNKVDSKLSTEAKSWYQFGKADVSPAVRDEIAERTKVYINNNIPFKDAVKQAYLDISTTAGTTKLSGPNNTVVRFSPEVMTGQDSNAIQKKLLPAITNIKSHVDGFKDIPETDFILMPSERTSATNPTFEIWYRDKYGNSLKVRDNNYQPIYFNARRKD